MAETHGVIVVGGGVIGLSVAWRAARAGYAVTVVDPTPARGASWVAGGMLAPVTEAWPGEEELLRLGEDSLRRWPEFATAIADSGADPGLATDGTLVAATDHADAESLDMLGDYLGSLGREAIPLSRAQVRRYEPGLDPAVRSGLLVPGDLAVDTRKLLDALVAACRASGVQFVTEQVREVDRDAVHTSSATYRADSTVLAAGAWSGSLHPDLAGVIRPLKGEVLRLGARRTSLAPPRRTLRAVVQGRPIYLVPRADGTVVLGATQYEAGFDHAVTAGGLRLLLDGAERLYPSVSEYELVESAAGVRASSVDNLPVIGRLADGVLAATGHHRNGVLLAPVTAEAVVATLAGEPVPRRAVSAGPERLGVNSGVS